MEAPERWGQARGDQPPLPDALFVEALPHPTPPDRSPTSGVHGPLVTSSLSSSLLAPASCSSVSSWPSPDTSIRANPGTTPTLAPGRESQAMHHQRRAAQCRLALLASGLCRGRDAACLACVQDGWAGGRLRPALLLLSPSLGDQSAVLQMVLGRQRTQPPPRALERGFGPPTCSPPAPPGVAHTSASGAAGTTGNEEWVGGAQCDQIWAPRRRSYNNTLPPQACREVAQICDSAATAHYNREAGVIAVVALRPHTTYIQHIQQPVCRRRASDDTGRPTSSTVPDPRLNHRRDSAADLGLGSPQ